MTDKFTFQKNVTLKEIDGQTVLFSKKTGDFFGLNDSAAFLLKMLVEGDFDSTLERASTLFKVEPAELRRDLEEIIADLEGKELLERISA